MDIGRAAAHVRAQAARKVQIKLHQEAHQQQAGIDASPAVAARVAVPAMFDALLEAANRIAIGGNNRTSRPARGRLMQVLKMYADRKQVFNEESFFKLLTVEFRGIPASTHSGIFLYISRHQPSFPLTHLLNVLIPDGFTKERSVLDFPCTMENMTKKNETLEEAAEEIRLEMIQHLRTKRLSMRDYFTGIDEDGSGSVDIAELLASLRHDNMGIGRYHACKNLVSRFDESGRGRLTFGDFEQMLALASPKSQLRLERLGLVGGSSRNGSGSEKNHSGSRHRSPEYQRGGQAMVPAAGISTSPINAKTRTSPFTVQAEAASSSPQAAAGAGAGAGSSMMPATGSTRSPVASPTNHSSSPPPSTVRRSPSLTSGRLSVAVGGSSGSSLRKSPSFAGNRNGDLPSPFSKNFELHQKAWGGV